MGVLYQGNVLISGSGGEGGVGSLAELGVTATAAELNFVDGATSNIQEQIDTLQDAIPTKVSELENDSTLGVANGGTGATTFTSGAALIGAGTGAVTTRTIRDNTATSGSVTADTALITSNTLRYAINRTTSVAAADTSYTTLMARGMSLNSSETNPAVNGAIAWTYE